MDRTERLSDTYDILCRLGEGSGGIVYKAYHKRLRQEVVLKQIRSRSLSMEVNRREVDILKNLHHSYLPQVLDFLDTGRELYTVMSFIQGQSLLELLRQGALFTENQMIRWGMQICSALNYLHRQNPPVIHGDIKPSNIMVTPGGGICLIDFNISFYLDGSAVLGYTDGYTSPEQYIAARRSRVQAAGPGFGENNGNVNGLRERVRIDDKTDIYGVGAVFYHLATGQKLRDCKERPDRKLLKKSVSQPLAHVIEKAVKINPSERYVSAYEMFRDFQDIPKKDKKYRALLRRQTGIRAGIAVLCAGFIVLGGYGIHEMKLEKTEKYNRLVEKQAEYIDDGEFDRQERTYEEARDLLPSALESYYQNARSLYMQREYEKCISFIDYDILENEKINMAQSRMADVYYLKADSHFWLGNYEEALEAYEELFDFQVNKAEYYRDYAITLAYAGEEEEAEDVLSEAEENGLKEDSIYYARGEIKYVLGESEAALEDFRQCLGVCEDTDLMRRTYLMMSRIYEESGSDRTQRDILLQAQEALPAEAQMQVLEELVQADIQLADSSGDEAFLEEAIQTLEKIIAQGWDTYNTYDTMAVLYEKTGELEFVDETLKTMENLYGSDYNIYKRRAFLEISVQQAKDNGQRDYADFAEYYEEAKAMYSQQDVQDDAEMQLLDEVYGQVEAGGWLD